jgi:hypothetical protein
LCNYLLNKNFAKSTEENNILEKGKRCPNKIGIKTGGVKKKKKTAVDLPHHRMPQTITGTIL